LTTGLCRKDPVENKKLTLSDEEGDEGCALPQQERNQFCCSICPVAMGNVWNKTKKNKRLKPLSIAHGRARRIRNSILKHSLEFYQQTKNIIEQF
jgi:hypothetical protein